MKRTKHQTDRREIQVSMGADDVAVFEQMPVFGGNPAINAALVNVSARPKEEKWQTRHNNLHCSEHLPCMECHGEHQVR